MKEVICIHLGQAGVQIGSSFWKLNCLDNEIFPDGKRKIPKINQGDDNICHSKTSLFKEQPNGTFRPRALFLDLEPTVIDEIKKGSHQELFEDDYFVHRIEDASSNFAKGKYSIGKEMLNLSLNRLRSIVETCHSTQGFLIFQSKNGGTGSGFTSLLLEKMKEEYEKKIKIGITIFPSPKISTNIVEPYNCTLATSSQKDSLDAEILFDNEALYRSCDKNFGISSPLYKDLNSLISQVTNSLTSSLRYCGPLQMDLYGFLVNIIPFHRARYLVSSFSPSKKLFDLEKNRSRNVLGTSKHLFHENSILLASCDPKTSKYFSCCMIYRGDYFPSEIHRSVCGLKDLALDHNFDPGGRKGIRKLRLEHSEVEMIDATERRKKKIGYNYYRYSDRYSKWKRMHELRFDYSCTTGFKCVLDTRKPVGLKRNQYEKDVERTACMIGNSNSMARTFSILGHKFDLMYQKKAFVHWYLAEGMEKQEFSNAREDIADLESLYEPFHMCGNCDCGNEDYGEE